MKIQELLAREPYLSISKIGNIWIVPNTIGGYRTYPVGSVNTEGEFVFDPGAVEITIEQYRGLQAGTHRFNNLNNCVEEIPVDVYDACKALEEKRKFIEENREKIAALKKQLSDNDYKYIRQQRERMLLSVGQIKALTMSEADYTDFCMKQLAIISEINLLEDAIRK